MATAPTITLHPGIEKFLSGGPKKLWLGGQWTEGSSGAAFKALNPATAETLAEVCEARAADVDAAVKHAREAFDKGPWPRMNPAARSFIRSRR